MNSKHAASVILILLIVAMGYGTMVMKTKLNEMQEAESGAQQSYDMSMAGRQTEQSMLQKRKRETEGKREYYKEWLKYFEAVDTEAKSETQFNNRIKMGGLIALNRSAETIKNDDKDSSITNAVKATLTFEDDYKKAMEWLANFESGVPASRVSQLKIKKGESGDEIRMELEIDFPLLANADAGREAPKK